MGVLSLSWGGGAGSLLVLSGFVLLGLLFALLGLLSGSFSGFFPFLGGGGGLFIYLCFLQLLPPF